MASDRVRFDVACALSVVSESDQLTNIFPEHLAVAGRLSDILRECVDPKSFEDSSCKLLERFPQNYALPLGKDKLTLAPGGSVILGGSGVTIQLQDAEIKRFFALKVPRVSVLAYQHPDFRELDSKNFESRFNNEVKAFENERLIFRRLSHENVAQHFYGSHKLINYKKGPGFDTQAKLPFSISEWIDGAQPLHKYLVSYLPDERQKELSFERVLSLVMQSMSAVAHLQERKVQHWDIKCDNLLVSKAHVAKLIDFGNAKKLDILSPEDVVATTTEGKFPLIPVFKNEDTGKSESRRFQIRTGDLSWNDPFLDIWMLIQEWNRCLNISPRFLVGGDGKGQPTAKQRLELHDLLVIGANSKNVDRLGCLRVIFDRALYPFDAKYVGKFIHGVKFKRDYLYYGREDSYQSANEVIAELKRINTPFGDGDKVPELLVSLDDIVRLPVTGNSVFTKRIEALVQSELVKPTEGHNQLAQVRRVFPGATHTRFEHLLGTVTTATQFVRSLYLNEMNAFWRTSVTAADIDATILGAILHDVGHIAFGHFIEEMDDFFSVLKHTDYTLAVLDTCLEKLGQPVKWSDDARMFTVSLSTADELIRILGKEWVRADDLSLSETAQKSVVNLLQRVRSIFDPGKPVDDGLPAYLSRCGTQEAVNSTMKSIIDGPLDADKLDYLRRDALHAGVMFASGIDLERFFESLRVCVSTTEDIQSSPGGIGVSEKGIAPIESIITARYQLFAVVYWHRTTRCITAMLQRVLSEVFMTIPDDQWKAFLKSLLQEFRCSDDARSLDWLALSLGRIRIKKNGPPLSELKLGVMDPSVSIADLLDALQGNRSKFFKVGFELSYIERVGQNKNRGLFGRERLHREISEKVYGKNGKKIERRQRVDLRIARNRQTELVSFRKALEKKFQEKIVALGHPLFRMGTILLDVPEPGKDQISTIRVDSRTKRSHTRGETIGEIKKLFPKATIATKPDFAAVTTISPIAGSLDHALNLWARKIRIFMSPKNFGELTNLKFTAGEIAVLWEQILYEYFEIHDENQSELVFEP